MLNSLKLILLVTSLWCGNALVLEESFEEEKPQCGYEKCYLGEPGMLNVHLVPHTHDDVGWLNTVDGYFYTTVQYILDTVDLELEGDATRRFIYVEMAFFTRWWQSLGEEHRKKVKKLVNRGQLEFILGGWSMNDEASTHYTSIIDQHTLGFDFLRSTFGECAVPRIGWQIDPFGHSREQASLFAQFGFDGLFFARLDYQDYTQRRNTRNLEHMWLASESLGDQASLFTGALYGMSYGQPGGFCYECGDGPVKDDPSLDGYNLDVYVKMFQDHAKEQATYYTTNHIMWPMGSDFQYSNARINFKNNEKLIKAVNKLQENGSLINAFFSTPSCYLYALNQANLTYEAKNDDFFPYAHRDHTFWSGYFTSRPALKGYERSSNNLLQICKQLQVVSDAKEDKLDSFKQIMGVLQHHDAVSGTAKQFVTDNYAKMLSTGVHQCQEVMGESLTRLLSKKPPGKLYFRSHDNDAGGGDDDTDLDFVFCNLLNVSTCDFTEQAEQFTMVVYNPLGTEVSQYIRIPVSTNQYQVLDADLHSVPLQIQQVSGDTGLFPGLKSSNFQLTLPLVIPPLGYTTYFFSKSTEPSSILNSMAWKSQPRNDVILENEYLRVTFRDGLMKEILNKERNIAIDATQRLLYYPSMAGDNSVGAKQASGAYIFRPNGTKPLPLTTSPVTLSLVKGALAEEVHQRYTEWASVVLRLYKEARHLEVEWTVGPIPVGDGIGKEVVSRIETSIDSGDTFYTDANGRELLKRVRNHRDTWKLEQTEEVAGNYYPVNSRIIIRSASKDVQLSVLNDRSQGGSSMASGQVELMVHRRMLYDDALGVGEALNETGVDGRGLVVRGTHYIFLDTVQASTQSHRMMARQLYMAPYPAFTQSPLTPSQFSHKFTTRWSGIDASKLPTNVHILSLEKQREDSLLLRLEHFFQKDEHDSLSTSASVSLRALFLPRRVEWLREMTLGANRELATSTRLSWRVRGGANTQSNMSAFVTPVDDGTLSVHLKAMQIRTFLLRLSD